jgi:hypothetical protein
VKGLDKIEEAAARMIIVLPHIQAAADRARTERPAGLGVIAMRPEGGGRVTAQFEAETFFADLAILAAAPALIEENKRLARLAREGWEQARNMARAVSLTTIAEAADIALAEIGEAPAADKIRARLKVHHNSPPVRDCECYGCKVDRAELAAMGFAS